MDREDELEAAKVGERIKQIRTDSGLNQREFAVKIGLSASSPSLVSEMERGQRDPSRRVLIEIHKQFGRDLNWLLGFDQVQNGEQGQEIENLKTENRKLRDANDELRIKIQKNDELIENQARQIDALRNEVYSLLKENSGLKDELIRQMRQKTGS
jgi:transcriptional regulator with XRE-family HTH domain